MVTRGAATFEVDHAVLVGVGLLDHVSYLLLADLLSDVRHHRAKLVQRDEPVPIFVEHCQSERVEVSRDCDRLQLDLHL